MKIITKGIWVIVSLILIIAIGIFFVSPILNAANLPDTREEAVKLYLECMEKGEFDKYIQFFSSAAVGKDPSVLNSGIPLEEAEKKGIVQAKKIDTISILQRQREFVTTLFGKDAWMNVEYSIKDIKSPEVKEQWVEKASGKVISENEGRKKLKEYWDNVGLKEHINPKDIFSDMPAEKNGEVKDQKHLKLLQIKEKYAMNEPVEVQLVPYYSTCEVKLKFNGKDAAPSGEYDFRFSISNKNGKWILHDGLNWTLPEVEPEGDI